MRTIELAPWLFGLSVLGIWTRTAIAYLDYRDRHKEE